MPSRFDVCLARLKLRRRGHAGKVGTPAVPGSEQRKGPPVDSGPRKEKARAERQPQADA